MEAYNRLTRGAFQAEKLRIALDLLRNESIVIPRKELVGHSVPAALADSDALPAFLRPDSWQLLLDILESPKCQANEMIHPKLLHVVARVTAHLLATLPEGNAAFATLLYKTLQSLSSKFSLAFRPSLEDLAKFLSEVLPGVAALAPANAPTPALQLISLVVQLLNNNILQQYNAKKVFSLVATKLFKELLHISYWITRFGANISPPASGLKEAVEELLGLSIFHSAHLPEFAALFESRKQKTHENTKPAKKSKPSPTATPSAVALFGNSTSYPKQLLEKLLEIISAANTGKGESEAESVAYFGVGFLFRKFVTAVTETSTAKRQRMNNKAASDATPANLLANTSPERLGFEMFSLLADFVLPLLEEHDNAFQTFSALLEELVAVGIYKPTTEPDDHSQSNKLTECLTPIISKLQTESLEGPVGEACFRSLRSLLLLNHTLVEPLIPLLLSLSWQQQSPPQASDLFWATVVDTFSQLRQLDGFFGRMLTSLSEESRAPVTFFPGPAVWASIAASVEKMPQGQMEGVWKQISDAIASDLVLPLLTDSNKEEGIAVAKLECACRVFVAFVENLRVTSEGLATQLLAQHSDSLASLVTPILLPVLEGLNQSEEPSTPLPTQAIQMCSVFAALKTFKALCQFRYSQTLSAATPDGMHIDASPNSAEGVGSYFSLLHTKTPLLALLKAARLAKLPLKHRLALFQLAAQRCQELFVLSHRLSDELGPLIVQEVGALVQAMSSTAGSSVECWQIIVERFFLFESFLPLNILDALVERLVSEFLQAEGELSALLGPLLASPLLFENRRLLGVLVGSIERMIAGDLLDKALGLRSTTPSLLTLTQSLSSTTEATGSDRVTSVYQAVNALTADFNTLAQKPITDTKYKQTLDSSAVRRVNGAWSLLREVWSRVGQSAPRALVHLLSWTFIASVAPKGLAGGAGPVSPALTSAVELIARSSLPTISPSFEFQLQLINDLSKLSVAEKELVAFVRNWLKAVTKTKWCSVVETLNALQGKEASYVGVVFLVFNALRKVLRPLASNLPAELTELPLLGLKSFQTLAQSSPPLFLPSTTSNAVSNTDRKISQLQYHSAASMIFQFVTVVPVTSEVLGAVRTYASSALQFLATQNLFDSTSTQSTLDIEYLVRVFKFVSSLDGTVVDKTLVVAVLISKIQSAPSLQGALPRKLLEGTFRSLSPTESEAVLSYLRSQLSARTDSIEFTHTQKTYALLFVLELVLNSARHAIPLGLYAPTIITLINLMVDCVQRSGGSEEEIISRSLDAVLLCLLNKRLKLPARAVTSVLQGVYYLLSATALPPMGWFSPVYKILWNLIQTKIKHLMHNISSLLPLIQLLIIKALKWQSLHLVEIQLVLQNAVRLYDALGRQVAHLLPQYAPYIIVHLVDVFQHEVVLVDSRRTLQQGVFGVMDWSSDKEFDFVFKSLDDTGKAVFKQLFDEYARDHKFKGKV